ncbi:hypothetical protein FRB95_003026 [Tulasnella sp. JGI-2019a]|nr:hypothetical protein FRB95_003026 [Tulasnella sp. JGI-2019a]
MIHRGLTDGPACLNCPKGCAIVADHCFWITNRDNDNAASHRDLENGVQSAIQAYRSRHEKAVGEAILEAFSEPNLLSLSRSARNNLVEGKEKDKKETEFSKELNKELSERLLNVILQHCLPKVIQPVFEAEVGSAT